MNNYEDWAQLVAKRLKGEADLIAAIEKDELEDTAANEAFVRAVLEPFLPENFGVGSGRIVDAFGNQSEHIDIVVYNRDFPRIGMLGANNAYLYESVLAVFSVRAKFIRKTFFDSLDACASLAHLETNIDKAVLVKLARKNGLKPAPNKKFVHEDPLRTARFELIGRPPAFVFGFSGIKHSYRQLHENVELWLTNRQQEAIETPMKALPAVIATQGCFAWRNAAPLALSNREMLGIGNDDAPVRLIVLQLLYLLNRRLNVTADGYGLKPSLNAYLSQFSAPKFEIGVGNVAELINLEKKTESAAGDPETISARYEPAKDHSPIIEAVAEAAPELPQEIAAAEAIPELPQEIAAPADDLQAADQAGVFDKPSPFASAPVPPAAAPTPVAADTDAQPAAESAVFDKPSLFASAPVPPLEDSPPAAAAQRSPAPVAPLGSAPIPQMGGSTAASAEAENAPPRTPLGSAPIPPMQDAAPAATPLGSAPIPPMNPAANTAEPNPAPAIIPPKPPVDFDLGSANDDANEDKAEEVDFTNTVVIPPNAAASSKKAGSNSDDDFTNTVVIPPNAAASSKKAGSNSEDDFINTVVIPPNAAALSKKAGSNSTDAFIARVKEQLSPPEQMPENKKDPFASTIPH
jgi:hypothetical protein